MKAKKSYSSKTKTKTKRHHRKSAPGVFDLNIGRWSKNMEKSDTHHFI